MINSRFENKDDLLKNINKTQNSAKRDSTEAVITGKITGYSMQQVRIKLSDEGIISISEADIKDAVILQHLKKNSIKNLKVQLDVIDDTYKNLRIYEEKVKQEGSIKVEKIPQIKIGQDIVLQENKKVLRGNICSYYDFTGQNSSWKKYGYIRCFYENEQKNFGFHDKSFQISNEEGIKASKLALDCDEDKWRDTLVEFELLKTSKGNFANNIRIASAQDDTDKELCQRLNLENIEELIQLRGKVKKTITEKWNIDAKSHGKYFFDADKTVNYLVNKIMEGNINFITGMKGTGKTAIANYICSMDNGDDIVCRIYNDCTDLDIEKIKPEKYKKEFTKKIYKYITSTITKDVKMDEKYKEEENMHPYYDNRLGKIKYCVGNESGKSEEDASQLTPDDKLNFDKRYYRELCASADIDGEIALAKHYIEKLLHKSNKKYYIIFDDLENHDESAINNELIKELLKAVYDIRSTFPCVHPVLFFRDDTFEAIGRTYNDIDKIGSHRAKISWNEDRIQNLIAFRISKTINPEQRVLSFEDALRLLFPMKSITTGNNASKPTPLFSYISDKTFMRPRDFIKYFILSAEKTPQGKITQSILENEVLADYSGYFKQELEADVRPSLSNIGDILSILQLAAINKDTKIKYENFEREYLKIKKKEDINVDFVLKKLFDFGVIGNVDNQPLHPHFYKYLNPAVEFDSNLALVVHPGLRKAVGLM